MKKHLLKSLLKAGKCVGVFLVLSVFAVWGCLAVNPPEENSPPKVSIIVPVYNVKDYLEECLRSIVNQTLENVEIICVNDGSTDDSFTILQNYAPEHIAEIRHINEDGSYNITFQNNEATWPIMKIIDKPNGGISTARNVGMEIAQGEYIMFVDSDDYIAENACEIAYNYAREYNADILCFGWYNFPEVGRREDCSPEFAVYSPEHWFEAKRNRASIRVWNKLYKHALIQNNGFKFNEECSFAEDEHFNLCVYPNTEHNIVCIPDKLYFYRNRPGSLMYKNAPEKFKDYFNMWGQTLKKWKEYDVSPLNYVKLITYPATYRGEFKDFGICLLDEFKRPFKRLTDATKDFFSRVTFM